MILAILVIIVALSFWITRKTLITLASFVKFVDFLRAFFAFPFKSKVSLKNCDSGYSFNICYPVSLDNKYNYCYFHDFCKIWGLLRPFFALLLYKTKVFLDL